MKSVPPFVDPCVSDLAAFQNDVIELFFGEPVACGEAGRSRSDNYDILNVDRLIYWHG